MVIVGSFSGVGSVRASTAANKLRHLQTLEDHKPVPPEKNILLVKEFLGHASLENTLLYIQVEQAIFGLSNDDEYGVTATDDKEEIKKPISVGFEYICEKGDILFFRKRK